MQTQLREKSVAAGWAVHDERFSALEPFITRWTLVRTGSTSAQFEALETGPKGIIARPRAWLRSTVAVRLGSKSDWLRRKGLACEAARDSNGF